MRICIARVCQMRGFSAGDQVAPQRIWLQCLYINICVEYTSIFINIFKLVHIPMAQQEATRFCERALLDMINIIIPPRVRHLSMRRTTFVEIMKQVAFPGAGSSVNVCECVYVCVGG